MVSYGSAPLYRVKSLQTRDLRRKGSDNSSKGRGIPGKDLERVLDWKRMNRKVERCRIEGELERGRSVYYTKGCQDLQDSLKYLYSLLKTQLVNIIYRLNRST
jgi:hypothetical protein